MIIINADDFGLNEETNWAIIESMNQGLCSSTTILANGDAFEEAAELARDRILEGKVGLHLNLTELQPLTQKMRNTLFCSQQGNFHQQWRNMYNTGIRLSSDLREIVYKELEAQLQRCLKGGIKITHFDSHHHVHTIPGISGIVCSLAKEYGITSIRISRNCGLVGVPFHKTIYKKYYKFKLRNCGFRVADYFGSINDVKLLLKDKPHILSTKVVEVMCHPRKSINNIVDLDGLLLYDQISEIYTNNAAISYEGL